MMNVRLGRISIRFLGGLAIAIALHILIGIEAHSLSTVQASPLWSQIFDPPPPPPRTGTGRGDELCLIAPYPHEDTATVWSDTPTLTWQSPAGLITKIEISSDGEDQQAPIILEVSAEHIVRTEMAGGRPIHTYQLTLEEPLERGEDYRWWTYRKVGDGLEERASRFVPFQVMEDEESDRITESLRILGYNREAQTIREPIAIAQADFLAREQLWADAWQLILAVPNPSEELEGAISETLNSLCALEE
ncbi:MAG: hypothetical protein WBA57_10685 [Elainellaceae cyanobacterium]